LQIIGREVNVDEILEEIEKDIIFYRNSGGGVTFSGGEPTFQPTFTRDVLKGCKERNISTALDTCGFVSWPIFEEIIEYADLLLYDIKHMDPIKHRQYTGVSNELILDNLERVRQKGKEVTIGVPVIAGCNSSELNIRRMARYVKSLGIRDVDLLPSNEMAESKYRALDREFKLSPVKYSGREFMEGIKDLVITYGLNARIR